MQDPGDLPLQLCPRHFRDMDHVKEKDDPVVRALLKLIIEFAFPPLPPLLGDAGVRAPMICMNQIQIGDGPELAVETQPEIIGGEPGDEFALAIEDIHRNLHQARSYMK